MLVNWLGREATQILNSVDTQIDNTDEVFEALEKVFRPESNQTLAHFKFRNMKQKASQMCDAYMSELRLALPECKYRNDSDELLKDQFIFGIYDKEIQDHLLGEIKETDNSVKALYEARKIESKLAQRKLLGIVTPTALSVEAIKRGFKYDHRNDDHRDFKGQQHDQKCDYCGQSHRRGKRNCPAFGKTCDKCGGKTTLGLCVSPKNLSQSMTQEGQIGPREKNVHEIECQNDMEDLTEQVQSLFYA